VLIVVFQIKSPVLNFKVISFLSRELWCSVWIKRIQTEFKQAHCSVERIAINSSAIVDERQSASQ
jgi:hypothetical protein